MLGGQILEISFLFSKIHIFNFFFSNFYVIFEILYVNLEKKERNKIWHTYELKIMYFHSPWMLNGENQSVNTSEIGFWMWLIVKKWSGGNSAPEGRSRTKKMADVPYFFISLKLKP